MAASPYETSDVPGEARAVPGGEEESTAASSGLCADEAEDTGNNGDTAGGERLDETPEEPNDEVRVNIIELGGGASSGLACEKTLC